MSEKEKEMEFSKEIVPAARGNVVVTRDSVAISKDTGESQRDSAATAGGNKEPECSAAAHTAVRAS